MENGKETNKEVAEEVMLSLRDIRKDYYVDKKPFHALKGISLNFPSKGLVCILGHSGCGKTTLLNIIGGLDHYTSGDLIIEGKSTKEFTDRDWDGYRNERVGFVFQSYNLIPHMNVISNVEVGLMLNGVGKSERERRALEALDKVGLKSEAKKRPNQLSGGQMQRVALARALVNNPKIILADEPTGALDSKTSIQVMDLFKEASATRLVIMVTHNKDLADRYADRVINMSDGLIVDDSAPLIAEPVAPIGKEQTKKTSMSFWTALKSSLQNISTKKARTILTAVASSFGIIGVALVLALSNGFSQYVNTVESQIAGAVPITITPLVTTGVKTTSTDSSQYTDEKVVYVNDESSNSVYTYHQNKYTSEYINDVVMPLKDDGLASSILLTHNNLNFHVLTTDGLDGTTIKSVNQYRSAGSTGSVISYITALPATVFHQLYGDEDSMSTWYDVIEGRYPETINEVCLITDSYNRVSENTLRELGILAEDDVSTKEFTFDEILGKTYKVYRNCDFYSQAEYKTATVSSGGTDDPVQQITGFDTDSFQFTSEDSTATVRYFDTSSYTMDDVYSNDETYGAVTLKVVGILRPTEDSYLSLMPPSIGYTQALTDYMTEYDGLTEAEKTIKDELDDSVTGNVFMTKSGVEKLNSFMDILKDAGLDTLISAYLNGDIGSIDSSALDSGAFTDEQESAITEFLSTFTDYTEGMASCFKYVDHFVYSGNTAPQYTGFYYYLVHCQEVGAELNTSNVDFPSNDYEYLVFFKEFFSERYFTHVNEPASERGADETNLLDILAVENNYATITSILIFPTSLTTKGDLLARLDTYNEGKTDSEQIIYQDTMGSLTGSLGVLIQVISTVLIVFASISLVTSCVMTGIITYTSVVERTKEIGILRSCGARKKDVGRLFEAECVVIGFGAGLIGILMTVLLSYPISMTIDHIYPGNGLDHICQLNPIAAIILLAIAVLLSYISGLIPSRIAAKKDPVTALRSE
jgi:putative ABC transport system permease protein